MDERDGPIAVARARAWKQDGGTEYYSIQVSSGFCAAMT
jgi:hypothetical protein